ncbi:MAG: guanylate kinase [Acutalibacteraceae bacterium]|jgi:guanylate kinase
MNKKGLLVIFSGPSGSGKGTVLGKYLENRQDAVVSISATTRKPRPGEEDGVQYFFRSREEFEEMIREDQLLEYAEYNGNYYGTPRSFVERQLEKGVNVFLEIEVQGALKVMARCPDAVSIFLAPPSLTELEARLRGRGTESEDVIQGRLNAAKWELEHVDRYQYVVVNREVETAASDIDCIVHAQTMRTDRMADFKEVFGVC